MKDEGLGIKWRFEMVVICPGGRHSIVICPGGRHSIVICPGGRHLVSLSFNGTQTANDNE
jgi:hypothetical protein